MPAAEGNPQDARPVALRTDHERDPINLDPEADPSFSWRVRTDRRGARQTAYRVVVGRDRGRVATGEGEVWDSGRVESAAAADVGYEGPRLASDETYHWSVKLRTDAGETDWADPASFGTALRPEDWRGEWVSHQPGSGDTNGWRSRWRTPDSGASEWVQVDLGESTGISAVGLHPAEPVDVVRTPDDVAVTMSWDTDPISGFGFPEAYRVEVSDDPDFGDPEVVAEGGGGDAESADDTAVREHDAAGVEGRYIRVTATDLFEVRPSTRSSHVRSADRRTEDVSPWRCFALTALTVRDGDGDRVARGRPVEASSSADADTWGRNHLVNGTPESETATSSPLLRTAFSVDEPVRSARAHVAAVGYGELHVNGERVGDRRLDPAWTDYERRVLYSTYDVTESLTTGENALGLWLGRGWFSKTHAYWVGDGSPRGRVVLTVEFEDGTTQRVVTGPDWRAAESPLVENDVYDGETYDARRERAGWSEPGFDDSGWDAASVVDAPGGTLRPERIEPMRVVDTLGVEAVHDHPEGPILDFGQNFTGWLELDVDDPDAGDEVTLRHAEALTDEGDLSTTDLRTADATDTYVARGAESETYEPRFTYHGFRYAQVSGYPGEFDPADVTGKVVHTAMDRRGEFACSNEDLNQLQHNAVWGLRSNTHSIPEDCPQRDERFGWTGDGHISTRALLFNFDGVRFDEKWVRDHEDVASPMGYVPDVVPNKAGEDPADPTWSITRVMVPWYLYRHDGDERVLREQYEGMRAYVDYWNGVAEDGLVPDDYGKFGDWLAFENADGRRGLPHDLFNTAFVYQVTDTFAKIADVVGNDADAEAYRDRAETIADAFNDRYFDADAGVYGPGTQSSYAVPLFLGLVPDSAVDRVAGNLAEKVRSDGGKLRSGFLGTRPLIQTLPEHGYADLAYEVVSQPEQPGWVYMARQGATTMWERWNSDESVGSGMNSLNHSPFTHVSEFFYEVLAGIRLGDRPAADHVTVAPSLVDDLEWVSASVGTAGGEVAVDWERTDDGGYDLAVAVPWNGRATVRLPDAGDRSVTESGTDLSDAADGVESVARDGDGVVVDVGAGEYDFSVV